MVQRRGVGLVVGVLLLAAPAGASAATIAVTTTDDPGSSSQCSLRQAITSANDDATALGSNCTAGSGTDAITVPAGTYKLDIAGANENLNASGDLDIHSNLTIAGAGEAQTIVDGNSIDRVFDLFGSTVTISHLTIQHGHAPDGAAGSGSTTTPDGLDKNGNPGSDGEPGGGIENIGGPLTLSDVAVLDNAAGNGGAGAAAADAADGDSPPHSIGGKGGSSTGGFGATGGDGGGIYQTGPTATLQLTDSTVSNDDAGDGGAGGAGGKGGNGGDGDNVGGTGGDSQGGNGAAGGRGGGIAVIGGSLTIVQAAIDDNTAGTSGAGGSAGIAGNGGNYVGPGDDGPTNGSAGVAEGGSGSLIFAGDGGGIWVSGSTATITDGDIEGNHAGDGGGASAGGKGGNEGTGGFNGTAGRAFAGSGGRGGNGGGIAAPDSTLTIMASLFNANETGSGGNGADATTGGDDGTANSRGGDGGEGGTGTAIWVPATGGPTPHLTLTSSTITGGIAGTGGSGGAGGTGPDASHGGDGARAGGLAIQTADADLEGDTVAANGNGANGAAGGAGTGSLPEAGNAGGPRPSGGLGAISGSSISLYDSIVVDNAEGNCSGTFDASGANNLSVPDDGTCPATLHSDPQLSVLGDHGGRTATLVPAAASPAIDAAPVDSHCPATDQRGVARPQGAGCDIGAVERAVPSAVTGDASAITNSGATLSATVGNGQQLHFEFGTTTGYGQQSPIVAAPLGRAATVGASQALTGLAPGTTYHYRVVVTTPDGDATGSDRSFTTTGAGSPPPPCACATTPGFAGVKIVTRSVRLDSHGRAALKLSCPKGTAGSCKGTIRLTVKVKRKTVTLGRRSISIAAGKSKTYRITIARKYRQKTVRATATAAAKDGNKTSRTTTRKVTLRPAKKSRHR